MTVDVDISLTTIVTFFSITGGAVDVEVEEVDVTLLEPIQHESECSMPVTDELLDSLQVLLQIPLDGRMAVANTSKNDGNAVTSVDSHTALRVQLKSRAVQALATLVQNPQAVKVRCSDWLGHLDP